MLPFGYLSPPLGLAPNLAASLLDTLKQFDDEGLTLLLVSQKVTHTLQLARRAYVLENGRNVLEGTGDALLRDPQIVMQRTFPIHATAQCFRPPHFKIDRICRRTHSPTRQLRACRVIGKLELPRI